MKRAVKLLLSLLLTVVFGWWAFRDTNLSEQWDSLRTANYLWLIPYVGLLLCIHLFRTIRWGFLLSGIEKVGFRREGVLRQDTYRDGRYWDTIVMGMLREEWKPGR